QVIGRAGRADKPGRAVIQTYSPDNETIKLASMQDYDSFYSSAIKLRRQLQFPPFCEFVLLGVHGEEEREVLDLVLKLDTKLREYTGGEFSDIPMYIFGPFEAPIYKVNNVFRMRIIIKCQVTKRMRELICRLMADFPKASAKAAISVDINPASL
ncbi:MAG: primosomal protein N', partial [Clostridia bacterium]|nr:primosomal protein N' [Clostridia bacterium]